MSEKKNVVENNQETGNQTGNQTANANTNGGEQKQEQKQKENKLFGWVKRHWRGLSIGAAGLAAATGSAVLAYQKGKKMQASVDYEYERQQGWLDTNTNDDGSLDPNVE